MHSATLTTHRAQGQLTKREAQATYERKRKLNDITPYGFDAEAVILKEASKSGSVASFTLSPSETDLSLGQYWHELKWTNGENVYIIDSGRLNVLDRVFD